LADGRIKSGHDANSISGIPAKAECRRVMADGRIKAGHEANSVSVIPAKAGIQLNVARAEARS
jgi:hypothetical protein